MNTKFEDNTPLPEQPVYKEMTDAEMKKDTEKFDNIVKTTLEGIGEVLKEDKD